MAVLKWRKSATEWFTFYVEAIRNRLRRDLNLSDLVNIAEARKNIEIFGDNNKTHFHDDRYIPKINKVKEDLSAELDGLTVTLTGNAIAGPISRDNNNGIMLNVSSIVADKVAGVVQVSTSTAMYPALISGNGTQTITYDAGFKYVPSTDTLTVAKINATTITADTVYGAVWNDFAEFFPRGEETEPGDIIMLDLNVDIEQYVKAVEGATCVVGIHSGEFSHLIGGERAPEGEEFVAYNMKKFIPVGLAGRASVKFIGKSIKGERVVPSHIAGVGRLFNPSTDSTDNIIGMLVESDELTEQRELKIKFK